MSGRAVETYPAPSQPAKRQPLEDFLQHHELAYRIPILVHGGAIWIQRPPRLSAEHNPKYPVDPKDWILKLDPLPPKVEQQLSRMGASQFRDYVWIAVGGVVRLLASRMILSRIAAADAQMVDLHQRAAVFTLEDFIGSVAKPREGLAVVQEPIRDMVLYTHAWSSGWLEVEVERGNNAFDRAEITYETLRGLMEQPGGAWRLNLPSSVLEPRPAVAGGGAGKPAAFRIRGCRVGRARPFLLALKEALGGKVTVTAPKHWYRLFNKHGNNRAGLLEYLNYSLYVLRRDAFGRNDHKRAVAEFFAHRSNRRIDGSQFGRQDFDRWIPQDPSREPRRPQSEAFSVPSEDSLALNVEYRAPGEIGLKETIETDEDLGDEDTLEEKLRSVLPAASPLHRKEHPFPRWARYEMDSFDEMMRTFKFSVTKESGRTWTVFGNAFFYEIQRPVTEPGRARVLANFWPSNPSTPAQIEINQEDARLFGIV